MSTPGLEPSEEQIFSQEHYNTFVRALDEVMDTMKAMGASEDEARDWLKDFIEKHYFPVWRELAPQT